MTAFIAIAPCGPECRYATPLPHTNGEWVWCSRRGEPRSTGVHAQDCHDFASRAIVCDSLLHQALDGPGALDADRAPATI